MSMNTIPFPNLRPISNQRLPNFLWDCPDQNYLL